MAEWIEIDVEKKMEVGCTKVGLGLYQGHMEGHISNIPWTLMNLVTVCIDVVIFPVLRPVCTPQCLRQSIFVFKHFMF